jgi:hypothetical protein
MNAIVPLPIEIDPRACGLCGLTIDRHRMVDDGEGPEFFCQDVPVDELTLDELERRAELRRQEEIAAMVRDWERMDAAEASPKRPPPMREYRTPQSTIDAFWYVASLDDPEHLSRWLDDHPRDVPTLQKLWEMKHARP